MTPSLHTERLELRPGPAAALRAELVSRDALAAALDVDVPPGWPPEFYDADAVCYTLAELGDREDGGPWGFCYFILRPKEGTRFERPVLIGAGGLRGGPNENGEVEVGYGIVPEYQRQRLATEVVRAWVAFAFADPRVQTVFGQTLAHLAGSIGVMEKAGFSFAGVGSDPYAPQNEQVVRYELTRAVHEAARLQDR
jgi:[ribosomal protein S5]-alanine N-acetyltransferase